MHGCMLPIGITKLLPFSSELCCQVLQNTLGGSIKMNMKTISYRADTTYWDVGLKYKPYINCFIHHDWMKDLVGKISDENSDWTCNILRHHLKNNTFEEAWKVCGLKFHHSHILSLTSYTNPVDSAFCSPEIKSSVRLDHMGWCLRGPGCLSQRCWGLINS